MNKSETSFTTKILLFIIFKLAALFATISIYRLAMFAAIGAGYIQSLVTPEVSTSTMGVFGNHAFMVIIINGSMVYLLLGVWLLFFIFTIKLFESNIMRALKSWRGNDL